MKLLLTSAGIKNPSINDALLDLLGKPIAESSALCIIGKLGLPPTCAQAEPNEEVHATLPKRRVGTITKQAAGTKPTSTWHKAIPTNSIATFDAV